MASDGWLLLGYSVESGAQNMALDELLARRMQDDPEMPPVLRLYGWKPWAISLGHHQEKDDLDLLRCAAAGIDIVRRPTGGRAILHAEELTYCVVMPAGRRSVLDVYNDISRALVAGLSLFGVEVALQKSQPDFRAEYRKTASIPCFASSARYEIESHGKKLVGSAQRRFTGGERDVVLQHGSILCGPAHLTLPEYLQSTDPAAVSEVRRILHDHTVDLTRILGQPIDIPLLAEAVQQGFAREWRITFHTNTTFMNELGSTHA